jgi:uncharacterized surface protein with fasciclin (FAS1) repeats
MIVNNLEIFNMKNILMRKLAGFSSIGLLTIMLFGCVQDPILWNPKSTDMLIGDYVASNPDEYSEFAKLIELTGMGSLLNIRGPYTLFLPGNTAMFAYYKEKNVNSLEELSAASRLRLVKNHLIGNQIVTTDIGLGALRDTNAIGDFLVTEFQGSDIVLNKYSKIIKRNIPTANGYIHVVDKVLDPLTKDVFSELSANPSYSIFKEGLSLTGLKDTLQLISFPYGIKTARTRFTVLAVPDSVFHRKGINSIDDLITYCGATKDNMTSLSNPFYRYMEYHCLNGTFYLSDLKTGIYSILSRDNNVAVTVTKDYALNLNSKTQEYTGFIIPASNTPSKNGAIHAINDLLPVITPEPVAILFETTDFFDLKQGDYFGKYYARWYDGQKTFAKIKWVGDFMQYYYKPSQPENLKFDCLQMMGWWSISVTFPKVMKGKYSVSLGMPAFGSLTSCTVQIDGVTTPYIYGGGAAGGKGGLQKVGDVDFKTTAEHTITLTNIAYGSLFWDYVRFDPVK